MTRPLLALVLVLAGSPAIAGEPVKLGPLPELTLAPRPTPGPDTAKRVRELIAGLAKLEQPDARKPVILTGHDFAPIPIPRRLNSYAGRLVDRDLRTDAGLTALVALGPDALPALLAALDDRTPTKITLTHAGGRGVMWHGGELHLNPVNPGETAVYKVRAKRPRKENAHVESYTVTVGDVCFVAVGQIVGRYYSAVRYQPTGSVALNCPTHDAALRADVRAAWASRDARQTLFDSLRADYATEGVFNGDSLDGWDAGNGFQCGAAIRLLYYFPKEAAPLIAARLDKLDVRNDEKVGDYIRRCVANGVRADMFVKAVAWSADPAVREAAVRLFRRTDDAEILLSAAQAVTDKEIFRGRLEPLLAALPADESGPYGDGFGLLLTLAQRTPDTARPVFERYLRGATATRCHTVTLVLREAKTDWAADLLAPMLADTRTWGWTYGVEPDKNEPRLPIRVCDEAALTLSQLRPELKFVQAGDHAALDRQIATIRDQLKTPKK